MAMKAPAVRGRRLLFIGGTVALHPVEARLAAAYRSHEAAEEYFLRHERTWMRRFVTRRETYIVSRLLRRAMPSAGAALVLDAPCGTGRIACRLASAGFEVLGLDASLPMLAEGAAAGRVKRQHLVAGSMFSIPFRDAAFGAALCIRFVHHLSDSGMRLALFRELRRVTCGPVVASAWSGVSYQGIRRGIKRWLGRRPSARASVPLSTVAGEARAAGLRLAKVQPLFRFVSETAYILLLPA